MPEVDLDGAGGPSGDEGFDLDSNAGEIDPGFHVRPLFTAGEPGDFVALGNHLRPSECDWPFTVRRFSHTLGVQLVEMLGKASIRPHTRSVRPQLPFEQVFYWG